MVRKNVFYKFLSIQITLKLVPSVKNVASLNTRKRLKVKGVGGQFKGSSSIKKGLKWCRERSMITS